MKKGEAISGLGVDFEAIGFGHDESVGVRLEEGELDGVAYRAGPMDGHYVGHLDSLSRDAGISCEKVQANLGAALKSRLHGRKVHASKFPTYYFVVE